MQAKQKTGIDKKSAAHICNSVRRQIETLVPDFTPLIILFDGESRQTALENNARKILQHPAGQKILDLLRKPEKKTSEARRTQFFGLADHHRRGFYGILERHETLGVFFVNMDHFSYEFPLKSQILHMIWQALTLRDDYMRKQRKLPKNDLKPNFFEEETYEIKDHVIRPKLSAEAAYRRNLMADIFAASVQFMQGNQDAIRELAALRMRETLTPKDGFVGERYPFAVCHDTLVFMFDNYKLIRNRRSLAFPQAFKISRDIGETYTIPAMEHWKNFSQPAQHMAWIGFAPEIILGTAIYTSENPYVRSIGDMVVDYTGIEPEIVTSIEDFNPFIGKERTKNEHRKVCSEIFRKIIVDASVSSDVAVFYEEARRQNQRLMTGNPHGWCAHGLIKLASSYKEEFAGRYDLSQKSRVEELFEQSQKELSYETILKFSVLVFQRRRMGQITTIDDMIRLAQMNEEFSLITQAVEKSRKGVMDIFKQTA